MGTEVVHASRHYIVVCLLEPEKRTLKFAEQIRHILTKINIYIYVYIYISYTTSVQ
jgi:hypothetical protein